MGFFICYTYDKINVGGKKNNGNKIKLYKINSIVISIFNYIFVRNNL